MYCVSSYIVTLEIPYTQKLLICTNYHHFHYLSKLIL